MIVIIFRTELRDDAPLEEYRATNRRMNELVRTVPGFVSKTNYTSEDGDAITVVRFESEDALRAWREHPEHLAAQRRGREAFYRRYDVEVLSGDRAYTFEEGRYVREATS